jgi:WXXGXW repeat (2 copies)
MKTKLLGILLLAGSSLFAQTRFGVSVGPPPRYYAPPRYYRPGYTWIGGYWQPAGPRWVWRSGYWGRRPHPRAYWVEPRYYGNRWRAGYWR